MYSRCFWLPACDVEARWCVFVRFSQENGRLWWNYFSLFYTVMREKVKINKNIKSIGYRLLRTVIFMYLRKKWWPFKNLLLSGYGHVMFSFHEKRKATITMKFSSSLHTWEGNLELSYIFWGKNGSRSKLALVRLWMCSVHFL